MIPSVIFKLTHDQYAPPNNYITKLDGWCENNIGDYRLIYDLEGGKISWNYCDLLIEIIFENESDKMQFSLVWADLL